MKKILIVDDDREFRNLLVSYITRGDQYAEVDQYDPIEKGVPGVDFDWSEYGVLILDYNLRVNKTTGLDIVKANKNNKLFPATIMLTSEGDEDVAVRALKLGVSDYLRKEKLNKEILVDSVKEAFDGYNSRQHRLYSLDEVRQLAHTEAEKLHEAYKTKYEEIRAHEDARLEAERAKLQEELKHNQSILNEAKKLLKQAQSTSAPVKEVTEIKSKKEEAEAAVTKTNWKLSNEENLSKLQLEEDLKSFTKEMQQQEEVANKLAAHLARVEKLKETAKKKDELVAAEKAKSLTNEVSSQLGKDD